MHTDIDSRQAVDVDAASALAAAVADALRRDAPDRVLTEEHRGRATGRRPPRNCG
jgi:hypothetical protein